LDLLRRGGPEEDMVVMVSEKVVFKWYLFYLIVAGEEVNCCEEKISCQKMTPSFTRALVDFARRMANSPLLDANSVLGSANSPSAPRNQLFWKM
jgi:hypothetical protein